MLFCYYLFLQNYFIIIILFNKFFFFFFFHENYCYFFMFRNSSGTFRVPGFIDPRRKVSSATPEQILQLDVLDMKCKLFISLDSNNRWP